MTSTTFHRSARAILSCAAATLTITVASGALAQRAQPILTSQAASDQAAANQSESSPATTGQGTSAAVATDQTTGAATQASASPPPPQLSDNPIARFFQYQAWEMNKDGPPADPNAPPSRKAGWSPAPTTTPPMPFTEWPYGGATLMGTNRPNSVDSPLMVAIANTGLGKAMQDAHIQLYGWVDVGGNVSSSTVQGGNSPGAYDYNPNTVQLDQAVLYLERTPDTVQTDHVDWGFRVSAIYGVDYRYTTSYGLASWQLLKHNKNMGYDFPMVYGEVYVPQIAQGLLIRFGRYISLPDIEAQLAPNNYMYSHSLTYTYDNYTNTGVNFTLAATKNVFLQFGISDGSETALWNVGRQLPNLYVLAGNRDPLYPGTQFRKDPGARPSYTGCLRLQTDSARDNIYFCANSINTGAYGYNNLQWLGFTYYHKFNEHWHISTEFWHMQENGVPNIDNPTAQAIIAGGGTPFSPQFLPYNAPNGAHCHSQSQLSCNAPEQSALFYLNYSPNSLNNFSIRGEVFDDIVGQRTGVATTYYETAVGWQHWLSPQIELRPELVYYHSANQPAFNGNSNLGIAPDKKTQLVAAGDLIIHF
ncbi:MAG: outer membrane beta-barrel protein [Caulobacteraceae bacterium]|nr:outer membrane beta-barrel protein [Caulobacteraceae bacterium]